MPMKYFDKIYGSQEISGLLEELIHTPAFQRLKNIHQGGAIVLVNPQINHTRFDHSVGVFLLIKKLGGSSKEQVAGLLHDISHTAFSHLIDYVLDVEDEDFHEKRFEAVLNSPELIRILHQSGLAVSEFLHLDKFTILEC